MNLTFTDNVTKKLIDVLKPSLSKANEIKFAVAFAKYSGFALIEDVIKECLEDGGKAEFLLGLDFRTTEPRVLRILDTMAKNGLNIKLFCFSDPLINDMPVYHPKIYLVRKRDVSVISIGSSNLTSGGLKDNVEVNAVIRAHSREEVVSDIYGIYNRLKFQEGRFEPDLAYIDGYEEAYNTIQKKSIEALKERRSKNRIKELKKRERTLPKPRPTKYELFGWQKLVYERLPEDIFSTSDIYAHEEEFRKFYPENKYIRAKVRQILQQLRDLGLLKHHISENKWERAKEKNNE
jgi:HKD family nuclease